MLSVVLGDLWVNEVCVSFLSELGTLCIFEIFNNKNDIFAFLSRLF